MNSMRRLFRALSFRVAPAVIMALVAFGFAGCSDDDNGPASPAAGKAKLRALHLSPDAPAVDVFVNGAMSPAVTGLAFQSGTGYLEVPAGSTDIDIALTGGEIEDAVLSVADLNLARGMNYTAVAYNSVAAIAALALADDLSSPGSGNIRVRAIHTAAGVGQVDIWNVTGPAAPSPLYPDFDFAEIGVYLTLPAGAYRLGFDVNNDATPDVTFALPSLPAGTIANVFAVRESDGDLFLLAQFADGSVARVNPVSI